MNQAIETIVKTLQEGTGDKTSITLPLEDLNLNFTPKGHITLTHLEVSVSYNIGGSIQRGYHLHLTPIEKKDGWVSMPISTGGRYLLEPVSRKSKAARARANNKITPELIESLIEAIRE